MSCSVFLFTELHNICRLKKKKKGGGKAIIAFARDTSFIFYVNVQLGGPDNVAEITGRRGMLVRASCGKGVTYQARNT